MAFIPVPDAASIVVPYSIGAITMENVFGYRISGPLDATDVANAGASLAGAYNNILGSQKTTLEYQDMVMTDQQTETGPQLLYTGYTGTNGTDTSNLLPYQTAALISWITETRGRSFRGRTYVGGFCEAASDGRDVNAALVADLEDMAQAIVDDGNFVVISRFSGVDPDTGKPIPRDEGVTSLIIGFTVHPLWRTQRRRATR